MMKTSFAAFLAALICAAPVTALADHTHGAAEAQVLGDLAISDGFTRAMLPNAPVAGGFLSIANNGTQDDRLISASSDRAGEVQIHEMAMQGHVMKMRELPDGLAIPAGQTVELKPGGYHLMFLQVKTPFAEDESVPVTLVFEKAGSTEIELPVGPADAKAAAHGHGGHDDHSGH
ncbi:copper chaperone PCu(A)C [Paracoccus sp. MBLB3053]|uniref:Copper chaperone PCu(A)C n=1 Tax=Paracoccus aurantius TaxID=3073814 RepID=A0ABU2HY68_9RHOB|nr:copper chaperone PCu(A)C [Paracoccus sp. MBLB3053]MDS9470009.1 copper chaperone PCu(A)C [Paracoccus sp. MBLB3053]